MRETDTRVLFFNADVKFVLQKKDKLKKWLSALAKSHKKKIVSLNYIFVSDNFLLSINKKHLGHNTLTDIISFDYSIEKNTSIVAEVYISIPRVYENALIFKKTKSNELHRVMAHGLLHLCGFSDKSKAEKLRMQNEEENALFLLTQI
jgi:probable rRNA maturation factor